MSDEIRLEGIGVAPGVLDTIVTMAAQGVEGVAAVGAQGLAGLAQKARKGTARAVSVCVCEENPESLDVVVHIQAIYGSRLRDVARGVQAAVVDAITSQVGVEVASVDVFVDGIVFAE
ncbi:MAG: Asp23/Gls24 family envelope stress response protein [Coriobacteriales bacterium]|nr:Asp23/Gls24 family envelope stress response protein [Coriobacteriales bacterium]